MAAVEFHTASHAEYTRETPHASLKIPAFTETPTISEKPRSEWKISPKQVVMKREIPAAKVFRKRWFRNRQSILLDSSDNLTSW